MPRITQSSLVDRLVTIAGSLFVATLLLYGAVELLRRIWVSIVVIVSMCAAVWLMIWLTRRRSPW